MGDVLIAYIPTCEIDIYWDTISPMLRKAAARYENSYGFDVVERSVREGNSVLWVITSDGEPVAAMTTIEVVYPRRKTLRIELLGGKGADYWAGEVITSLAQSARAAGFAAIETHARLGWSKLAKKHNFKAIYTAYEMDI